MKTEIKPLYHHQHGLSIHGGDGTEFNVSKCIWCYPYSPKIYSVLVLLESVCGKIIGSQGQIDS